MGSPSLLHLPLLAEHFWTDMEKDDGCISSAFHEIYSAETAIIQTLIERVIPIFHSCFSSTASSTVKKPPKTSQTHARGGGGRLPGSLTAQRILAIRTFVSGDDVN